MAYRRLAYHWNWLLAIAGTPILLFGLNWLVPWLRFGHWSYKPADTIFSLVAVLLGGGLIARSIVGSRSSRRISIDLPAGLLRVGDEVLQIDELGELVIHTKPTTNPAYVQIRAGDRILFASWLGVGIAAHAKALNVAVLYTKLRRALEAPEPDGDAYRGGPDVTREVDRLAADAPASIREAALRKLCEEPDPTIRGRATKLRARAIAARPKFVRLAWHRSWFLVGFGLVGMFFVTAFVLDRSLFAYGSGMAIEEYAVPIFGGSFALLCIVRGLTGSWSQHQIKVDPAAGLLHLADGKVMRLDELGDLTITKHVAPYRTNQRHRTVTHQLRVANLPQPIFTSVYESEVKLRLDALSKAVEAARR